VISGVGGCLFVLWVVHWRLEVECIVLGGCLSYCFMITQFVVTSQMRPFIYICTLQVLLYITQSNAQRNVKKARPQGKTLTPNINAQQRTRKTIYLLDCFNS
jgi:hypothetical protein